MEQHSLIQQPTTDILSAISSIGDDQLRELMDHITREILKGYW
jgi:hypothetical protein